MLAESQEKLVEYLKGALNQKVTAADVDDALVENAMLEKESSPKTEVRDEVAESPEKSEDKNSPDAADATEVVDEPKLKAEDAVKQQEAANVLSQNYIDKSAMLRTEIQALDQEIRDLHENLNSAISKKKDQLTHVM